MTRLSDVVGGSVSRVFTATHGLVSCERPTSEGLFA